MLSLDNRISGALLISAVSKSLLYRLFGVGKIPAPLMSELKAEGLVLFDEGVKGSITYRDFRAPGKRFIWKRQWFAGSVALTERRLVAIAYSSFLVNVPLSDERFRKMHFAIEGASTLCIAFDASLFHADWSGEIEYRFLTIEAQYLRELLQQQTE